MRKRIQKAKRIALSLAPIVAITPLALPVNVVRLRKPELHPLFESLIRESNDASLPGR